MNWHFCRCRRILPLLVSLALAGSLSGPGQMLGQNRDALGGIESDASARPDTASAQVRQETGPGREPNDHNPSAEPTTDPKSGGPELVSEHFAPLFLSEN